jgi:HrpA-like RNA helicase
LKIGDVESVLGSTIEPPAPSRIEAAQKALEVLGALDVRRQLTPLGRALLDLPVNPALGKLCMYGALFQSLDSALTLAAIMSTRDPLMSRPEERSLAHASRDSWASKYVRSDPIAVMETYNAWSEMRDFGDNQKAYDFIGANFLSSRTLMSIREVKDGLFKSLSRARFIKVLAAFDPSSSKWDPSVSPESLNKFGDSLTMLAAMTAISVSPRFAVSKNDKVCQTASDKVSFVS